MIQPLLQEMLLIKELCHLIGLKSCLKMHTQKDSSWESFLNATRMQKNQNDSAINSRNIADHIILQSDRLTIVPDYPHPKEDPGLFCLSCIFV